MNKDLIDALTLILNKLEEIDQSASTRNAFATSIIMNSHYGLTAPIFKEQIEALRKVLNLPDRQLDILEADGVKLNAPQIETAVNQPNIQPPSLFDEL